jgi:hypothetical protein
MDDDATKEFLRGKTEEIRNTWLRENPVPGTEVSYWETFYRYGEAQREAILAGDVHPGWSEDRVYMAWGAPFERRRLAGRPATRSELFVYRFEVDADGAVRVWEVDSKTAYKAVDQYQMDVFIDDGRVTELVRKEQWE